MSDTMRIAVIGAGLMGHGLAQVFAAAGHPVAVFDPYPRMLDTLHDRIRANLAALGQDDAAADRVQACVRLEDAVGDADYIVECAVEDLAAKQDVLARAEAACRADAIIASNTSVIPIFRILEKLRHRERGIGTHWWNPPYLVPLVEVVATSWTTADVLARTMELHRAVGQTPVHVKRDVPGFIGNRMQHALWREAISLVEHGICDAETVDIVVKASFGRRLGVLGPLENADLVGTDLTLAIHRTVLPAIEASPDPSPYLEDLVATGRLGMKSGSGFRAWSPEQQARLRSDVIRALTEARRADTAGTD